MADAGTAAGGERKIMTDTLIPRMVQVLRIYGRCVCQFERNAAGVPVWYPSEGGGIERRLVRECSVCLLLREFDAR